MGGMIELDCNYEWIGAIWRCSSFLSVYIVYIILYQSNGTDTDEMGTGTSELEQQIYWTWDSGHAFHFQNCFME